jgi:hypothetical protein
VKPKRYWSISESNGTHFMAWRDCKKCYGRGHLGRVVAENRYIGCKCLRFMPLDIKYIEL